MAAGGAGEPAWAVLVCGSGQADGLARQVQPYGCFVPREVDGLLLAGRCISGTHEAHASYRVQPREVDVPAAQAELGLERAAD